MSLYKIEAVFTCDGCGCQFKVELDAAQPARKGRTFFDIAVDEVRGGSCTVIAASKHLNWANVGMCSVQNDKHLCPKCTREADKAAEESDDPEA